ncbi:MAG: ribonuclease J [Myxococcota bacterium]
MSEEATASFSGPQVRILPLGGCGEVGLNAMLLLDGDDGLLIDCGALLGLHNAPGAEKAVPGFEPLFESGRRIHGVVLTHGHEDHVGALPALLAEKSLPIVGTPLTLSLARSRMERPNAPVVAEARIAARTRMIETPFGATVQLGPFSVEFIRVTHSLPESAALSIRTRAGHIVHSGDFKLDPTPFDGPTTDTERLSALGDEGVDLLLSDSTNAERPGHGPSESAVAETLEQMVASSSGRVVVTLVSSHIHRIRAAVQAALRSGRRVAIVGRALEDAWKLGVQSGYLPFDPGMIVRADRIRRLPRREVLVLATGAQGEWQGGLHRIAFGSESALWCEAGDRVIVSARVIPGNEVAARRVQNQLLRRGADVVNDRMALVHCSGHAHAGEQAQMLRLVRPRYFVPVHGERAMLQAHARTAEAAGLSADRVIIIENGESVVLRGGEVVRGPKEVVSQRAVDTTGRLLEWDDVRARNRIGRRGLAVVSVVLDQSERPLAEPVVSFKGVSASAVVSTAVSVAVKQAIESARGPVDETMIHRAARAALKARKGLAPTIECHILRVRRPTF